MRATLLFREARTADRAVGYPVYTARTGNLIYSEWKLAGASVPWKYIVAGGKSIIFFPTREQIPRWFPFVRKNQVPLGWRGGWWVREKLGGNEGVGLMSGGASLGRLSMRRVSGFENVRRF